MRIAIGQLWQETNTFNPLPTTRAGFESFGIHHGPDLVERMADINELGGFIRSLRAWPERPEIIGLARYAAWPSGAATAATVADIFADMLTALEKALPIDGVLLALHGSMVAEGMPDVEGTLLTQVRNIVGPGVPVIGTLDLHANVTHAMMAAADALVIYHTAPHVDVFETGERGARVLRRILVNGVRPVRAFAKVPLVPPAERANTQDPKSVSFAFRQWLQECEASSDVLCAGLTTVQPWIDIPEMGSSVVIVARDRENAERRCRDLAERFWARRKDYLPELVEVADAVRQAAQIDDGLVVLGDPADATTSGSTGDGTAILSELLKYAWPRPALVTMVAPDIVAEAQRRGLGAQWTATLGGVLGGHNGSPVTLEVTVANLFEARFVLVGHLGRNLPIDMGPSVVLRHGNIHILTTSRSGPHFAVQFFQCAGLDPFAAQVLVAKSPCGFRAAYQAVARKILMVRGPGCAPTDFWTYPYHHIPHPLWPWDEISEWRPQITVVS